MAKFSHIILLLFFVCLCGCESASPKKDDHRKNSTLRLNLVNDPQTLDPRKVRDTSGFMMMRMLFEGLTRMNQEEKSELALANKVSVSEDLKTYTFYLRHAQWTNGDPVTAQDFAYAWKKILDPLFLSDNAYQLYVIKNAKAVKEGKAPVEDLGVRVLDPLTFQVELENPVPYFLELTSFPIFFPVNQRVDHSNPHWAEKAATYVSNGPFAIKKWQYHNVIDLKKNKSYWDKDTVRISDIEMVMVKGDTDFKMFEKQDLDWVGSPISSLPLDALPKLKDLKCLKSKSILGTSFLRTNVKSSPLNHVLIRKALALSIDRQSIIEHVLQGNQLIATSFVPPCMGLRDQPYFADGDKKQAKTYFEQALQEMGISAEKFPEISLMYFSKEQNHLIAQTIQQQWLDSLGIHIKLDPTEAKVYFSRLSRQDYQIAMGSWLADFNDPINFLEVFKFKKGSTNNTHWENKEYSALLDESFLKVDPKERLASLEKCEQILLEEMPIIPIYHFTMLYMNDDKVKNVFLSSLGNVDFKWAYLDNSKKDRDL